jgi:hypothetical protein
LAEPGSLAYNNQGKKGGPSSLHWGKPLPTSPQGRVQTTRPSGWSLIATPEHKIGFLFLEGWVRSVDLAEEQ